ncbi:hypothetical protein FSP39_007350 [Pinctada imbricata]|uniref:Uncharacterized protein n=1 Tax=Pinctada imbricata TaxID=66713 RepID=A0AA88Y1N5_PINIB|nr:hypothetical protein FSP39_007350 [Pinctada imbricata]
MDIMENLNYYESERYEQNERMSLYECIQKIMKEDHYRERQDFEILQTARDVAKYLIQSTYTSNSYYQSYIQNRRNQVELSSFHIEDSQTFRCNVSLKLPSPIETFQIHHKKPQEMPPHRILVTLDEDLGKADRVYQKCIWEDCVDEESVLRPDYVLKWFNKGIIATCEEVKIEGNRQRLNRELECDYFETKTETRKDGTICVHVSIGKEESYPTNFTINFVPSLPLKELPKQIRLRAPFPDRSEYVGRRDKFIKAILKGIKSDAVPLCLEARVWLPYNTVGLDQSIGVTWAVSCSALEEKAFQDIRNAPNQTNLGNVIILMDRIKQNHIMGLHPVTRSLIQNAIFHIYRMNLEKVQRVDQWFLKVMKLIANQLKGYCAPCFFMNSKNILEDWDLAFVQWMGKEMEKIIRRLKKKPISLLDYIGTNKGPGFWSDTANG